MAPCEATEIERRQNRAACAVGAYVDCGAACGPRPPELGDPDRAEAAITDLLCDLRHLVDDIDLPWSALEERAWRYYAEKAGRHVVELTLEGFQIRDARTGAYRADVWSSPGLAATARDELDGVADPSAVDE